jgi:hypothetical protein
MRSPVPGEPVPASAIDQLTAMANGSARANGGGTAEWASAVVTTREKALTSATPGDFVPESAETIVFLVTMKGHFVSRRAAPGAKNPTGNYLSIVVNAEDFRTLDFGIHPNSPPLAPASFGPLTYLKVGAERGTGSVQ